MKVEIFKGKGVKNWRVRLIAANGFNYSTSQGYFSHFNAKRAARKMHPKLPKFDANGKLFT